jgi:hypothetical protein
MSAFRPNPEELKEILAEAEELSGYISEDLINISSFRLEVCNTPKQTTESDLYPGQ